VVEEVQVVAAGAGDRGGKGVVLAVAQRRPGADGAVGGVVDECPAELVDGHDAVAGGAEGVEVHDVVRIRRRLEARGGRGQGEHVHGFRVWVRLGVEQGLHVDAVQRVGLVPVVGEAQVDMAPACRRSRHRRWRTPIRPHQRRIDLVHIIDGSIDICKEIELRARGPFYISFQLTV
jgi:hypothetical protein